MKRAGFTMIELIFVIVILGILAAVAIPKLAATRSDAEIAKMATNAATIVSDYGAGFTARGDFNASTEWGEVTNVPLESAAGTAMDSNATLSTSAVLSDGTNICVTFNPTDSTESTLVVTTGTTGTICTAVAAKLTNLAKTHSFGGTGVQ